MTGHDDGSVVLCEEQVGIVVPKTFLGFPKRHVDTYVPTIPPWLRTIYDASCFSFWAVAVGLIIQDSFHRPWGAIMSVFMLGQPFFSYMGDSHEFMAIGKNGVWGCADRIWALCSLSCSIVFVATNEWELWGPISYFSGLVIGMMFWFAAVFLLRIECNRPKLWALFHILWHLFPSIGGVILTASLRPYAAS